MSYTQQLVIRTKGQGLYEITDEVIGVLRKALVETALCTVFICHTSASLTVQENADPSAKRDLEKWLNRLVPEGDPLYTHTSEGPDDMPAHIKAILTQVSISIPICEFNLCLGTWQGIYLWEHRHGGHQRKVVVNIN